MAALRSAWPGTSVTGPSAEERMTQRRSIVPDARFQPLPDPAGAPPYRRELNDLVGPEAAAEIADAGALSFHCVGDTGGYRDPRPQRRVAAAMAAQVRAGRQASGARDPVPRFFYHLGDVVYPHGEEANYRPQFHAAYADYTAPIVAVPGNHDAEGFVSGEVSLAPFVKTFCAQTAALHEAGAPVRPPAGQPHVHWTLVHDWLRIVGVWANVPEGGQFADAQLDWLTGELRDTPPDVPLILALHQPVYSADVTHGSNLELVDMLDACAARAGRGPDAIFSGHAHVYERFVRRLGEREIPHIVAGAGGYPELHRLGHGIGRLPARFAGVPGVTLEAFEDRAHGFMTVTARPGRTDVVYTAVTAAGSTPVDAFSIRPPLPVSR